MALLPLEFSKDWRSNADFPTVEENETKVREDMQYLFDEIKNYINTNLVDTETSAGEGPMSATQIPFVSSIAALEDYPTIKQAIDYLYTQIAQAVIGQIADRSVIQDKLSRVQDESGAAVGTENIQDEAVALDGEHKKVSGLLAVANGGLGVDISTESGQVNARQALGLGAAATQNILPLSMGGLGVAVTNSNSKQQARENLGLGDCSVEDVLPVAKGGTNASTVAGARKTLGLGNTDGALPVANGGTEATTPSGARANLSAQEQTVQFTKTGIAVTVEGTAVSDERIKADAAIIVTYAPSSKTDWQNGDVYCSSYSEGALVLSCISPVTVDVNILVVPIPEQGDELI